MEPDRYRYERKYVVAALASPEIESLIRLHPAHFVEQYPPRFVNNLYFDSPGMRHYEDHIDGQKDRVKVRIRWYGELFGPVAEPILEFKIKVGMVGRKERYPLPAFVVGDRMNTAVLSNVIGRADLPSARRSELGGLRYSLLNRYRRRYFEPTSRCCRLTVDSCMEYHTTSGGSRLRRTAVDRVNTVVELKYDPEREAEVESIAADLPFRVEKHSKYLRGVEGGVWGLEGA